MARLDLMLFNYEQGGRQPDGLYNVEPLGEVVSQATPHILVMFEAFAYGYRGNALLYQAANTITRHTGKVFVPLLCWTERGDYPPAVFYQPEFIQVEQHMGVHPDDSRDKVNLLSLMLRENGAKFGLLPVHWAQPSGTKRLLEAEEISWAANPDNPMIIAGDFNSVSANKLDAQPNFDNHPAPYRFAKGQWLERDDPRRDLPMKPDTRALDRLLDQGLHDVADLAYAQGMPQELAYCPTINEGMDGHGSLRIDRILLSEPLKNSLIPDTYKVWVPEGVTRADFPSDHRAVSSSFDI